MWLPMCSAFTLLHIAYRVTRSRRPQPPARRRARGRFIVPFRTVSPGQLFGSFRFSSYETGAVFHYELDYVKSAAMAQWGAGLRVYDACNCGSHNRSSRHEQVEHRTVRLMGIWDCHESQSIHDSSFHEFDWHWDPMGDPDRTRPD